MAARSYASTLDGSGSTDEVQLEWDLSHAVSMHRSPRMRENATTSSVDGSVNWAPVKSVWWFIMAAGALVGAPLTFSWSALMLCVVTTGLTICLGHSLGMHRRLIHRSFECPLWLEYILVYLGTLVGMAGPSGMIAQHDIRDWAQRLPDCHAFLAHRTSFWRDSWWQLHCGLTFDHPPILTIECRVRDDRLYRFLDRTMMLQQMPWAVAFFALGGLGYVFWGICMRIFLSLTGHWLIGHFAHNRGPRSYLIKGAGVQGFNVPQAGLVSMGEAWHNNHHAYPASARLGLADDEIDLGWQMLRMLRAVGLVWNVNTPDTLPVRTAIELFDHDNADCNRKEIRLLVGDRSDNSVAGQIDNPLGSSVMYATRDRCCQLIRQRLVKCRLLRVLGT